MLRQNDDIKMNVSELLMYFRCPRQVYYLYREHELIPDISSRYIESMLLKELAFTYPDIINTYSSNVEEMGEDITENLETELGRVYDNIGLIRPGELNDASLEMIEEARSEISECIKEISKNLTSFIDEHGKEELLSCINPIKTDPILYSKRIGLSGMPAKLVCHAGNIVPSVIKTGKCPENGVWNNDRLHIAALAMLVEEKYGKTVEYGFVEYARYGIVRKVFVRANDRRQILKIGNRVKKIKDGTMPDKKESKLCEYCSFLDICNKGSMKASLASKFF